MTVLGRAARRYRTSHLAPQSEQWTQDLQHVVATLVGHADLDTIQHDLKRVMLTEALQRTAGNLSRAAALLGVSRQAVQQMLSRYEMRAWAQGVRQT